MSSRPDMNAFGTLVGKAQTPYRRDVNNMQTQNTCQIIRIVISDTLQGAGLILFSTSLVSGQFYSGITDFL